MAFEDSAISFPCAEGDRVWVRLRKEIVRSRGDWVEQKGCDSRSYIEFNMTIIGRNV
ncbi:hypothetical protein [Coleofasciculus sp.]|uniref:hypothetical protein n=1 Tax=Coleofasciculus sp. TaxID=3100458 RepID=UPI0039F88064